MHIQERQAFVMKRVNELRTECREKGEHIDNSVLRTKALDEWNKAHPKPEAKPKEKVKPYTTYTAQPKKKAKKNVNKEGDAA